MGFRYRKSINLGGGFRINLSKSGVGYSWGVPGYRVTRTANGKTRKTYSIPGTGLSFTENSSGSTNKKAINKPNEKIVQQNREGYSIESAEIENFETAEYSDFLNLIRNIVQMNRYINIGLIVSIILGCIIPIFMIIAAILCPCKIYVRYFKKVNLTYEFDQYESGVHSNIKKLISILQENLIIWQVNEVYKNSNLKTNAGASESVQRNIIRIVKKAPFYISTNVDCFYIKLKKEELYILPDKILIISKGKVGAINVNSLDIIIDSVRFVESETLSRDATVIDHTWKYVNKNGSPDKRFKDNRQLPVCKYGTISFKSKEGLNILVHCSSINKTSEFLNLFNKTIESKN